MRTPAQVGVPQRDRPGPRGPGLVYAALGVALLVLLATVALTTRQPPPPSIAEFAPQAVEQIKDAPTEQSSDFGSGQGGTRLDAAPTPEPAAGPAGIRRPQLDVPRIRRCVGNPPRQIEDPQSPPCVPYWEGDNGGNTWRGVTRDEIRIMVPTGNPDQSSNSNIFPALERFFNSRFEFYGRKLTFVYGGQYPNAGTRDVATQVATAAQADEEFKVFASLRYRTSQGYHFHEELARRRIPSFTGVEWGYDRAYLDAKAPYIWQYTAETDMMLRSMGDWACNRLAGRPAAHAGDELRSKPRVFGIVTQTYYNAEETTAAPVEMQLKKCNAAPAYNRRNPMQSATGSEDDQPQPDAVSAQNVAVQLKNAGVTSVICICQPYAAGALMKASTNQQFFPEWLYSSYGAQDTVWGVRLGQAPAEQRAHMFGISFNPRQVKLSDEPHRWAVTAADPGFVETDAYGTVAIFNFSYRNILMLASAIQMAGPTLTPDTMAKGLQRAVFPNPDHPNKPGKVGFQGGSYAMTTDANEWWWSETDFQPYGKSLGTICYVDGGARHTGGSWPAGGDPFFSGPCDSGA